jgi:hypothetical protein
MFAYKNMNSASNIFAYYLLFQKRREVLDILKKGLQVACNSEAVESPTSLRHRRQTILQVEDDINNNQRAHNGPADGLNQKVKIYHLKIAS